MTTKYLTVRKGSRGCTCFYFLANFVCATTV